jgi:hypothetical protein
MIRIVVSSLGASLVCMDLLLLDSLSSETDVVSSLLSSSGIGANMPMGGVSRESCRGVSVPGSYL